MSPSITSNAVLRVVMYHYVRDPVSSAFPRLKGMTVDAFRQQVSELTERFEMARLDSALAFLNGTYSPRRDLCLLTFDDGLHEHFEMVTPILADSDVQGLFFVITGSPECGRVAPVHMNHVLTAELGLEEYRRLFLNGLGAEQLPSIESSVARRTYPWDTEEAASFKYLFNFALPLDIRDQVVGKIFAQYLGSEAEFAKRFYFSWNEAREMQAAGMVMGGHTNEHRPLAGMQDQALDADLQRCHDLLKLRLRPQELWPFCYPYGKSNSFDARVKRKVRELDYCCAFSTESGDNSPGADLLALSRLDCNRVATAKAQQSRLQLIHQ